MFLLRIFLFPFAIIYNLITRLRNVLYDRGYKPAAKFDLPIISVGNLTAGGTGKTPLIEHLVRLLSGSYKVVTLSRGYGRKTKGFKIAGDADTALTIGDEPLQFYKKFSDLIKITVGEERALAVPFILDAFPDTDAILLDDAFQHRSIVPSLNILLTDYNRPFYDDYLIPTGYLRESRSGAKRADVVLVTKCPPELMEEEMIEIEKQIRRYVLKPVFFAGIRYGGARAFGTHSQELKNRVILVTGIANATPFRNFIQHNYSLVQHVHYNDHHPYTSKDMLYLKQLMKENEDVSVVVTEKDMVKLNDPVLKQFIEGIPLFYIPIETSFIRNGEDFDVIVENSLKGA